MLQGALSGLGMPASQGFPYVREPYFIMFQTETRDSVHVKARPSITEPLFQPLIEGFEVEAL